MTQSLLLRFSWCFLLVFFSQISIWAGTIRGTITYNNGNNALNGAQLWFYKDSIGPGNLVANSFYTNEGAYSAIVPTGTYLMQITKNEDPSYPGPEIPPIFGGGGGSQEINPSGMPSSIQFTVGPVTIDDEPTTCNITLSEPEYITVNFSNGNNWYFKVFLTSAWPPDQITTDNLISSYHDAVIMSELTSYTTTRVDLPPVSATLEIQKNGQPTLTFDVAIRQNNHWLAMLDTPDPYVYTFDPITAIVGNTYELSPTTGTAYTLDYKTADGTRLSEVNPTSGRYRVFWLQDFVGLGRLSNSKEVTGLYPQVYLRPGKTYQLLPELSISPDSQYNRVLPKSTRTILTRDLVAGDTPTTVTASLPRPVNIAATVLSRIGNRVPIRTVYAYNIEGVASDLEGTMDGEFDTSPELDGESSLLMYEKTRILIRIEPPTASGIAPIEIRIRVPNALSLQSANQNSIRLQSVPTPPRFDLNITVPDRENRINPASPSQVTPDSTGWVSIPIVSTAFSQDPGNDQVNLTFARDITIGAINYSGAEILSDGMTAQRFNTQVSVSPSALTGYVSLTATINGQQVVSNYVLEIVDIGVEIQSQSLAGIRLQSDSNPRRVNSGAFSTYFPPSAAPSPIITPSEKPISGWRILEQAQIEIPGYNQFPGSPYTITIHAFPGVLPYQFNRGQLRVLHQNSQGHITEMVPQLTGPPHALEATITTNLTGLFSLAFSSQQDGLLPNAVGSWIFYQ
ncbi:MAG: hypothetical protein HY979_01410 [Candidatus Magasanikbacteria bacterium]|nr:hypothetical protein [Candidatus Magasanikbacteria bacterium]